MATPLATLLKTAAFVPFFLTINAFIKMWNQCIFLHQHQTRLFRHALVTDVYAHGVSVNLTPLTSKRGALATDARGCSLWHSLLERPPPAWESRV